ncbi:hypothetical protein VHUM_01116 [Vanrija humicola]|uniref:FAR-17a/AIG1-like protein n=1 Tax=Vanrija humicola TaxID=5417 RepID=A0A7D8Z3C3_VANHU|nr:hypothetical protein VHUM_01116 [Vanrija humicola]
MTTTDSRAQYGGQLQFLTILGLIVTVITFVLSAAYDVLPLHFLHATKRVFALIALPVEITISAIYWPLIIFAPALMLPPKLDAAPGPDGTPPALFWIPLWMDLGLHAIPAASLIIDFFLLEKKYQPPTSTRIVTWLATGLGVAYGRWAEHCNKINGHFAYPFLDVMSPTARALTYSGAAGFALVVFWGLNALHK